MGMQGPLTAQALVSGLSLFGNVMIGRLINHCARVAPRMMMWNGTERMRELGSQHSNSITEGVR